MRSLSLEAAMISRTGTSEEISGTVLRIPATIERPLQEALVNQHGGEVVVRGGPNKGRIYIFNGRIAWVTCDTIKVNLRDVLAEIANLSREDLDAAIQESKSSRRNFGETLIQWRLIDEEQYRRSLLKHNAEHFQGLLRFGDNAQAMFIPQERRYTGRQLYSLEEIVRFHQMKRSSDLSQTLGKLRSTHTVVPDCRFTFVLSEKRQLIRVFPEDALEAQPLQGVGGSVCTLLHQPIPFDSLPPKDALGAAEMVFLGDCSFCLIRRCVRSRDRVFGVVCEGIHNLGLSLGMARNALKTVCEGPDDEPSKSARSRQ